MKYGMNQDSVILMSWNLRNRNKSEHDNMIRMSDSLQVDITYIYRLLEKNGVLE